MDNVSEKIDKWLGEHPEYAFLIFIGVFLLVLLGIILNWKWAWEPRTSVGWELVNTLGEKDIPLLERCVYGHFNHHFSGYILHDLLK